MPSLDSLKRLLQSLAMLDAIHSPDWEMRYYSFDSQWSATEQLGSMRDGCGDSFFALFGAGGCFVKGFAHEAAISPYRKSPPQLWPGLLESLPAVFAPAVVEPAFSMQDTTFVVWHCKGDSHWSRGEIDFPSDEDPDGSAKLLAILDNDPTTYQRFAKSYYEVDSPLGSIQAIYDHCPLTDAIVASINAELTVSDLLEDADEIDYPH